MPTAQRPLRAAEFDALFARRLVNVSRPGPLALHLLLTGGPGVEEQVRDLAARESECCSFFTFTVAVSTDLGHVRLGIEVDAAHTAVLDALQARAPRAADGSVR